MKPTELMHNDLFMYGGNLCRFVIRSMDAIVQRLSDNAEFPPCAVSNAEPIPLTKDILVKNEIVYDSFYECYLYKDCELGIEIGKNGLYEGGYQDSFYMVYSCCFVHELQHAFRLCGQNKLADNFKV